MQGKTVLITGANSGIGREAAKALATRGASVSMICRNRDRGERALSEITAAAPDANVELLIADLSSQAEIRRVAAEFLSSHDRLDVLINNAGALNAARSLTVDGYETTFATNHLAYVLLTHLLLDVLKTSAPSRIINVASLAHEQGRIDFNDLNAERGYAAFRAYRQSKLANVLFTFELARRLAGTGVTANALHPGVVRTGFGKSSSGVMGALWRAGISAVGLFFIGPGKGAETSIYLASSPEVEGVTGEYFVKCRPVPASALARDEDVARRLWEISEQMTGIAEVAVTA